MDNKYNLRKGVSAGLAAIALAASVGCASTKVDDDPRFKSGYDQYESFKGEYVPVQVKFDGNNYIRTKCTEKDDKGNYIPSKGFYKTREEARAACKDKQGILLDFGSDLIGIGLEALIRGL